MKTYIKLLLLVFLTTSANLAQAASSKIGILVFNGFLTSDVTAPVEVFGAATKKSWFSSYEVVVISATENKTIHSEEGLTVVADKTIYDDLQLDVFIVPSAYDMDDVMDDENLIVFIQKQAETASWMSSNCSGAYLLAKSGVLDGKKATTWAGGETKLSFLYPKIDVQHDQNVVIDEGVVTTNGGPVSYQGAFEILAKLSSEKFSNEIKDTIQFSRLERAFK